ncbi:hypothetical protein [Schaalia sp. ZJ1691]|uniref:hypothetical protein n=1 Tax=Schaalia sp. ZJ1691 TaxID=2709404 RepID=UPI0013E9B4EE|nr:hypothetical protein [Schaalia sp. ZJ1691]
MSTPVREHLVKVRSVTHKQDVFIPNARSDGCGMLALRTRRQMPYLTRAHSDGGMPALRTRRH